MGSLGESGVSSPEQPLNSHKVRKIQKPAAIMKLIEPDRGLGDTKEKERTTLWGQTGFLVLGWFW
jgi:hypothetical protein